MPTQPTGTPIPPNQDRTVDDALAYGKQQWTAVWSVFARQFSQPQLIKLAEQTLGSKAIHSSQIFGFTSGKLRDPSPKLLMSLGYLNLAIAAANGVAVESVYKVPARFPELWQGKEWLKDASGAPLGPPGIFMAITGIIDLQVNLERHIPTQLESAVSQALGKFLRLELARKEVDWIGEMPNLLKECSCIEDLLMGKTVHAQQVTDGLEALAGLIDMDADQLWTLAIAPALK